MSKQRAGARRAEPEPKPIVVRIGSIVLPLAILALVATLLVFGDSIFNDSDNGPGQGETASNSTDAKARTEAAASATKVLDIWSRPELAYDGWWGELEPMLTPGGQQAYAFTDPAKVPDLQDVELDEVVLHGEGVTATVYFTTSEGRFGVDMSRRSEGAKWLANRVVFPDGESMFA